MEIKQVSYWLDTSNTIVKVNDTWDANMDSRCWSERASSQFILGRQLFDFICDDVTRMYVAVLLDSVRIIPKTIIKPYRCDSTDHKRFMEMKISPETRGLICLSHTLVREEPLPKPLFFQAAPERQFQMLETKNKNRSLHFFKRCSVCNQLQDRNTGLWQDVESCTEIDISDKNPLSVYYGVCPACLDNLSKSA